MIWKKLFLYLIASCLGVFLSVGIIPHLSNQIQAQSQQIALKEKIPTQKIIWTLRPNLSKSVTSVRELSQIFNFPPGDRSNTTTLITRLFRPPNRDIPSSSVGGGSRGGCVKDDKQIIPLIPQKNLGLTLAEYPELFFYVSINSGHLAEFVLKEYKKQIEVNKIYITIPKEQGIFSLNFSDNGLIPLEVNRTYQWDLTIICDPEDPNGNDSVEGFLERIEPSKTLLSELENTEDGDRLKIYGKAGIWYETLTTMLQLRSTYPDDSDLIDQCKELLKSVGLSETIAKEALLGSIIKNR